MAAREKNVDSAKSKSIYNELTNELFLFET